MVVNRVGHVALATTWSATEGGYAESSKGRLMWSLLMALSWFQLEKDKEMRWGSRQTNFTHGTNSTNSPFGHVTAYRLSCLCNIVSKIFQIYSISSSTRPFVCNDPRILMAVTFVISVLMNKQRQADIFRISIGRDHRILCEISHRYHRCTEIVSKFRYHLKTCQQPSNVKPMLETAPRAPPRLWVLGSQHGWTLLIPAT